VENAKETLEDFQKVKAQTSSPRRAPLDRQTKWSKPPLGRIKLNWNASVDRKNKLMGVGLIARDHTGQVRAPLCTHKPYVIDPTTAEALAARQGVELCHNLGFQSIVLEGDAQLV